LNLSVVGQSTLSPDNKYGELLNLNYVNKELAVRTIERHRDLILGIKIRLSKTIAGENDLRILQMARDTADAVKLPIMVHIGGTYTPLENLLPLLRAGDVVTHCFHGRRQGILDANGRVLPAVFAAIRRGVHMDVGHGEGSFSFDVADKAIKQGIVPDTISSDLHQFNVHSPVFDLVTTLSKFLHMGLTLEQVIARATANPVKIFGFAEGLGTLREGAEADISVLALHDGEFAFTDSMGQRRTGHQKLTPVATVKAGRLYGSATFPVPGS